MEFLVTTNNDVVFSNKELDKSTKAIFKLGNSIKANWFTIAHIIAGVDATECYKDDGFNNVHEWVETTFGIKKSNSYSLLSIGKEYLREITSASGKVVGYGSNLVTDGENDFSKTQIEKMLPAGHDMAVELVSSGEITPEMSAKDISKVVKKHTNPETETSDDNEPEITDNNEPETNNDDVLVIVHDDAGNKYEIPEKILNEYLVFEG